MPSASPLPVPRDPYDAPAPAWWTRRPDLPAAAAVFIATVVLTVAAFPPHQAPECAYALAAPAMLWAYRRPRFKLYAWTLFAAQAVAWTILLGWLRHVTGLGILLLGPFVGAWVGSWYLAVWWAMPRIAGRPTPVRLAGQIGLAALWVVIEWSRTWLLGGFPWLPLAASQWQWTSILQVAAFTGAGGVSFVLIAMNVGAAAYAHRLFFEGRRGFSRRSQEFLFALFLLLGCLCIFVVDVLNSRPFSQPIGRLALVQPAIPQVEKWDPSDAPKIWQVFEQLTLFAGASRPDLIVWPEASLPGAVKGDPALRALTEHLSVNAHAPLLIGSVAVENGGAAEENLYNGAFVITPEGGLADAFYAKRHLVPFGEYVPLRSVFGSLAKLVPIPGDFRPGTNAAPLLVPLPRGATAFGTLICYEDIFPGLARDSVRAGADILAVLTNDAWYGEEGETFQHAAHSVLRAVETRRPVVRCGNNGWSGWIDEFGRVRAALVNEDGSVYFRGTETVEVRRDSRWAGQKSFYVQYGDWFVLLCAGLASFGAWILATAPVPIPPAETEE